MLGPIFAPDLYWGLYLQAITMKISIVHSVANDKTGFFFPLVPFAQQYK